MARVKLSDGRIVNSGTVGPASSETAHPRKSSRCAAFTELPLRLGHKSLPCTRSYHPENQLDIIMKTALPEGCPSTTTPHMTDDPQSHRLHEPQGASHKEQQQLNKWQKANMVGALSERQRKKSNLQQRPLRGISCA